MAAAGRRSDRTGLPARGVRARMPGGGEEARVNVPSGTGPGTDPDEPMVLLPEDESGRFGHWTPGRWILVAVLIGAAAGGGAVLFLGGGDQGNAGAPARPEPERRVDPVVRRLGMLSDSLQDRLSAYWEAQDGFDRRRIGCDSLASVYRGVDEAFLSVAQAYRQTGAPADTAVARTFDRASTAADSANRRFDATGCRRPE